MTMHPYRTPCPPEPETENADDDHGLRLAFGVMTFAGAVQVAVGLSHAGPPTQTLFGGACFVAGMAWLVRQCQR